MNRDTEATAYKDFDLNWLANHSKSTSATTQIPVGFAQMAARYNQYKVLNVKFTCLFYLNYDDTVMKSHHDSICVQAYKSGEGLITVANLTQTNYNSYLASGKKAPFFKWFHIKPRVVNDTYNGTEYNALAPKAKFIMVRMNIPMRKLMHEEDWENEDYYGNESPTSIYAQPTASVTKPYTLRIALADLLGGHGQSSCTIYWKFKTTALWTGKDFFKSLTTHSYAT